jgi:phage terminase large subunit-like protein
MLQVRQGFASLSAPTKELLRLVLDRKLRHGGHPVLRWCASNLAPRFDPAGNVKPDKERSAQRIDPIQALIFAVDGWMRRGREAKHVSVYETRGLIVA